MTENDTFAFDPEGNAASALGFFAVGVHAGFRADPERLDMALVVADEQTAGRGRRGRGWVSPAGEGIFMTLILRPQAHPSHVARLSLQTALAVARAIARVCEASSWASSGSTTSTIRAKRSAACCWR